jgi:hypothetical protein
VRCYLIGAQSSSVESRESQLHAAHSTRRFNIRVFSHVQVLGSKNGDEGTFA